MESVSRDRVHEPLEEEAESATSDLRLVFLARLSMLCEDNVYDALIAESEDKETRRDESLQKVSATNQRGYGQYSMALFLLGKSAQRRRSLTRS